MHIRDDNQVLEVYIDFLASSMNGLDELCAKENELVQKINMLNKKHNLQIIHDKYRQYSLKLMTIWGSIYLSLDDLAETMNFSGLLEKRQSLYAITLPQKCVEQFFYQLYSAV